MRVFLLLILLLAFGAQAQVFTWINKDGVREYGDEPPEHASKADLPDIQSIPKDVFAKTPAADTDRCRSWRSARMRWSNARLAQWLPKLVSRALYAASA